MGICNPNAQNKLHNNSLVITKPLPLLPRITTSPASENCVELIDIFTRKTVYSAIRFTLSNELMNNHAVVQEVHEVPLCSEDLSTQVNLHIKHTLIAVLCEIICS